MMQVIARRFVINRTKESSASARFKIPPPKKRYLQSEIAVFRRVIFTPCRVHEYFFYVECAAARVHYVLFLDGLMACGSLFFFENFYMEIKHIRNILFPVDFYTWTLVQTIMKIFQNFQKPTRNKACSDKLTPVPLRTPYRTIRHPDCEKIIIINRSVVRRLPIVALLRSSCAHLMAGGGNNRCFRLGKVSLLLRIMTIIVPDQLDPSVVGYVGANELAYAPTLL